MARKIFLITVGLAALIGFLGKPQDMYTGQYADKSGKVIMTIQNDRKGYCHRAQGNLQVGDFKWYILHEDMNKLRIVYPNGNESTVWLGNQAEEYGFTPLFGQPNVLVIVLENESMLTAGWKMDPQDESIVVNQASIKQQEQ